MKSVGLRVQGVGGLLTAREWRVAETADARRTCA